MDRTHKRHGAQIKTVMGIRWSKMPSAGSPMEGKGR
jgi:hypothetical protein